MWIGKLVILCTHTRVVVCWSDALAVAAVPIAPLRPHWSPVWLCTACRRTMYAVILVSANQNRNPWSADGHHQDMDVADGCDRHTAGMCRRPFDDAADDDDDVDWSWSKTAFAIAGRPMTMTVVGRCWPRYLPCPSALWCCHFAPSRCPFECASFGACDDDAPDDDGAVAVSSARQWLDSRCTNTALNTCSMCSTLFMQCMISVGVRFCEKFEMAIEIYMYKHDAFVYVPPFFFICSILVLPIYLYFRNEKFMFRLLSSYVLHAVFANRRVLFEQIYFQWFCRMFCLSR